MNTERPTEVAVPAQLDEASELVLGALSSASTADDVGRFCASAVRERLMRRVTRSQRAASAFHTVRPAPAWSELDGVRTRWLYEAQPGFTPRPGQPWRVRQLEVAPGSSVTLSIGQADVRCEWLVMSGDILIDDVPLAPRDYHVRTSTARPYTLATRGGARVFLREAIDGAKGGQPHTVRDREAPWVRLSAHIERRVLCQWDREAALLYRLHAGVQVPHHGHAHDEECFVLEGEVFIDDELLRPGEYQLAPAGSHHEGVSSDTGSILFAHGDIELAATHR
jgi:quercetin dioxygenase-like cupin family protein